jgi:cardiolipin synthase
MTPTETLDRSDTTGRLRDALGCARIHLRTAAASVRSNRRLTAAITRFVTVCQLVVVIAFALVYLRTGAIHFLQRALVTVLANGPLLLFLVYSAGLLFDRGRHGLGWANRLTVVRFVLVAPLVVLVVDGAFYTALVVYGAVLLTDVLDGVVARWARDATEFGTIMDPLADIASTAALYGAFLYHGFIPAWVYLVLIIRYASLFAGSALLFLVVGPIRFRATPVGKIVGVLQGAAGIIILTLAGLGAQWQVDIEVALFAGLGIIFGSVIISQLIIAIGYVRNRGKCRILKAI